MRRGRHVLQRLLWWLWRLLIANTVGSRIARISVKRRGQYLRVASSWFSRTRSNTLKFQSKMVVKYWKPGMWAERNRFVSYLIRQILWTFPKHSEHFQLHQMTIGSAGSIVLIRKYVPIRRFMQKLRSCGFKVSHRPYCIVLRSDTRFVAVWARESTRT